MDGEGSFMDHLLRELLRVMEAGSGGSGARLELARTFAHSVATGGEPEANVDPLARIQLEELVRVAELHVSELTGLDVTPGAAPLEVTALGPGRWAWQTVEDWRFLLDAMTERAPSGSTGASPEDPQGSRTTDQKAASTEAEGGRSNSPSAPGTEEPDTKASGAMSADIDQRGPDLGGLAGVLGSLGGLGDLNWQLGSQGKDQDLLSRLIATVGPMMTAMQLGHAVGRLARTTMGTYELPVPRPSTKELLLVPANIDRFADDWSLPRDQVRLWVCIREVTSHAIFGRKHVAKRQRELMTQVVQGMVEDIPKMIERLDRLDPSDIETMQGLLADPGTLLETEPSPERRWAAEQLMAVTAAIEGFVEHVLDEAGARLLGGRTALSEAWRRRQVDRDPADQHAEILVGLDLSPQQVDRGVAFIRGALERAGEEGLKRLWESEATLPTPNEVDAPGLWLERIKLDSST